jgi:hypothetical protein
VERRRARLELHHQLVQPLAQDRVRRAEVDLQIPGRDAGLGHLLAWFRVDGLKRVDLRFEDRVICRQRGGVPRQPHRLASTEPGRPTVTAGRPR